MQAAAICYHEESQEEMYEEGAAERNAEKESWKPQICIFCTALFLYFQLLEPIF